MSRTFVAPLRVARSGSTISPVCRFRPIAIVSPRYSSSASSSTSPTRPCPKCQTPLPLPTTPCPSCSTLLPIPDGLSHHSLLGLSSPIPASPAFSTQFDLPAELSTLPAHGFSVDVRALRGQMLKSQTQLHPDRYGSQGERVVSLARKLSGRVNEAYATLADPLKRAEYIVSGFMRSCEAVLTVAGRTCSGDRGDGLDNRPDAPG
jgi:molecular chaperone HscB